MDGAAFPVAIEHFRRHPGGSGIGISTQIADTGMNMQHAVRRNTHQPVKAVAAGRMVGLADADANDLAAIALTAEGLFFPPS